MLNTGIKTHIKHKYDKHELKSKLQQLNVKLHSYHTWNRRKESECTCLEKGASNALLGHLKTIRSLTHELIQQYELIDKKSKVYKSNWSSQLQILKSPVIKLSKSWSIYTKEFITKIAKTTPDLRLRFHILS